MTYSLGTAIARLKRDDTPFSRALRKVYAVVWTGSVPIPGFVEPVGRMIYDFRWSFIQVWRRLKSLLYLQPIFSCRCESAGKRLQLATMPSVRGHTLLYIGDNVRVGRNFTISSGRFWDRPTLRIGNRVSIGFNVTITCNREITIEDDVLIAGNCRIADYDGHPSSMEKRISGSAPDPADIQPVRICKGAWIGYGVVVLKGVTVGEGGIVGANSVVTHDVPPHCVVAGSPARVVSQNEVPISQSSTKTLSEP